MKTSYAIICCKSGVSALLDITEETAVINTGNKKIKGEIGMVNESQGKQVYFRFISGLNSMMFRVVKMTTISPIKHRGNKENHELHLSKL